MRFFYEDKGGSIRADYTASLQFGAHIHNHVEMICMLEGSAKAYVDAKECLLRAGDVLMVFPNQVHQYERLSGEYCIVLIFPPEICPEFQSILQSQIPVQPVLANVGESAHIRGLFQQLVLTGQNRPPYFQNMMKGYFLVLLSTLFTQTTFEELKTPASNTMKDILNYCATHFTKDIRLETLSEELHISKYYISHLFTQKLRMGFHEYVSMLRISQACRLLDGGACSITETAYNVGFNSPRSFNRAFVKTIGITPSQYKKRTQAR